MRCRGARAVRMGPGGRLIEVTERIDQQFESALREVGGDWWKSDSDEGMRWGAVGCAECESTLWRP